MAGQRRSSEEWQRLIYEFEAGSESGKAFCLRHSLSPSNFYKRRSTRVSASPSAFVPARRAAAPAYADALFLFCNKQRDKQKVVYWDETGFCLWYKRLEKATYQWPRKFDDAVVELNQEQLHWLLRGFDITRMQSHSPLNYVAV